jgi:hypothetical protein
LWAKFRELAAANTGFCGPTRATPGLTLGRRTQQKSSAPSFNGAFWQKDHAPIGGMPPFQRTPKQVKASRLKQGGPQKFVYCIKETFRQAHLIFVANPETVSCNNCRCETTYHYIFDIDFSKLGTK